MTNVYDILLNFNCGRAFYFYEWDEKDPINHIKKIPIYRISDDQMKFLLHNTVKINNDLLEKLFNCTEAFEDNKLCLIEYCCIFGNTKDVIAIKFNKLGMEVSRSDMILDEKEEVIDLLKHLKLDNINFSSISVIENFNVITRTENIKRKKLKHELDNIYIQKDINKLKYVYYDIMGLYIDDISSIYGELNKFLDDDWCNIHDRLLDLFNLFNAKKQM